MRSNTPRAAVVATLAAAALLAVTTTARAAVMMSYDGVNLVATGDGANDIMVAKSGASEGFAAVQVPGATVNDPDGAGPTCSSSGDTAQCGNFAGTRLEGSGGNDTLTDSRSTNDGAASLLNGGSGNDTLTGGPVRNYFRPGPGADRVRGGSRAADPAVEPYRTYLEDGRRPADFQLSFAQDVVLYDPAGTGVTVTLDDQANDGAAGEGDDIGSDVESVSATNADDTLTAGANSVDFSGLKGNDTLNGGAGNDRLDGGGNQSNGDGSGSDTLNGNAGDDQLFDSDSSPARDPAPLDPPRSPAGVDRLSGGDGEDHLFVDAGADDLVGGAGIDRVSIFDRRAPAPVGAPASFVGPLFGVTITLDDQANDGQTGASEGDNVHSDIESVTTGSGPDAITGSSGPDELLSGAGNDEVIGGGGADLIDAGDGDDRISVLDGVTDRADGGLGNDSAVADLGGGQPEKADVLLRVENITGTPLPTVVDVTRIPVAPQPPGNIAPRLTVSGLTVGSKAFLRRGTFTLRVTTSERAAVVADLLGRSRFRAVGDLIVGAGRLGAGTGARRITLSVGKTNLRTFRRKLRTKRQRAKGIALRVRVAATDLEGLTTTTTRTLTIRG